MSVIFLIYFTSYFCVYEIFFLILQLEMGAHINNKHLVPLYYVYEYKKSNVSTRGWNSFPRRVVWF